MTCTGRLLDVSENCLVDVRYRAAKFVRNQCRIVLVLNNERNKAKEPEEKLSPTITWEEFKEMFLVPVPERHTPNGHLEADGCHHTWSKGSLRSSRQ